MCTACACAPQVTLDHAACLALCASCPKCRFASASRAHKYCAWFEECDASALWLGALGPTGAGASHMHTTYEVWGRAAV